MKRIQVLIAILACSGFLFAQMEDSTMEEKNESRMQEKSEMSGMKTISGKIEAVNVLSATIVVKTKKMLDTLNVDASAKIMSGTKAVTLGELVVNAPVTVKWKMVNGTKTATSIVEKPAATTKK